MKSLLEFVMCSDINEENIQLTNERLYVTAFDENDENIHRLPNLVVEDGPDSLRRILDVIKMKGIWWAEMPRFGADGERFYDYSSLEDLKLWLTDKNREYLLSNAGYNNGQYLTTIINSETPLHLMENFEKISTHGKSIETPWFDNMLPFIMKHIEEIRWAFVPLSGVYMALFITRPSEAGLIETIKGKLKKDEIPFCQITEKNGQDCWELPDVFKVIA